MKFGFLSRGAACVAAAVLLFASSVAMAQSAHITMTSDAGDWVGGGASYDFTDGISSSASSDNNSVALSVNTVDHWFYFNFQAPQGQPLAPGVYSNATRWPFQMPSEPGLSVYGDGRGCNTLTGSFTVLEAVYGPYGYLQKFHAVFEQHCEGMEPALYGEVTIDNPPPPPALSISFLVDDRGVVNRQSGKVALGGTVTCSASTNATVSGTVTQRAGRFNLAQGSYSANVPCGPTPTRWSATVTPYNTPFNQGTAQVEAYVSAYDPNYGGVASDHVSTLVNLSTKQLIVAKKNAK
jgi:hypothetical protein